VGHYTARDGSCVEVGRSGQHDHTRSIRTASNLASRDIIHVGNVDCTFHGNTILYLLVADQEEHWTTIKIIVMALETTPLLL
jgi:hypothetical protein